MFNESILFKIFDYINTDMLLELVNEKKILINNIKKYYFKKRIKNTYVGMFFSRETIHEGKKFIIRIPIFFKYKYCNEINFLVLRVVNDIRFDLIKKNVILEFNKQKIFFNSLNEHIFKFKYDENNECKIDKNNILYYDEENEYEFEDFVYDYKIDDEDNKSDYEYDEYEFDYDDNQEFKRREDNDEYEIKDKIDDKFNDIYSDKSYENDKISLIDEEEYESDYSDSDSDTDNESESDSTEFNNVLMGINLRYDKDNIETYKFKDSDKIYLSNIFHYDNNFEDYEHFIRNIDVEYKKYIYYNGYDYVLLNGLYTEHIYCRNTTYENHVSMYYLRDNNLKIKKNGYSDYIDIEFRKLCINELKIFKY